MMTLLKVFFVFKFFNFTYCWLLFFWCCYCFPVYLRFWSTVPVPLAMRGFRGLLPPTLCLQAQTCEATGKGYCGGWLVPVWITFSCLVWLRLPGRIFFLATGKGLLCWLAPVSVHSILLKDTPYRGLVVTRRESRFSHRQKDPSTKQTKVRYLRI